MKDWTAIISLGFPETKYRNLLKAKKVSFSIQGLEELHSLVPANLYSNCTWQEDILYAWNININFTFEWLIGDCDLGGVAVASDFFLLFGDCCWDSGWGLDLNLVVWLAGFGLFCLDFGRYNFFTTSEINDLFTLKWYTELWYNIY